MLWWPGPRPPPLSPSACRENTVPRSASFSLRSAFDMLNTTARPASCLGGLRNPASITPVLPISAAHREWDKEPCFDLDEKMSSFPFLFFFQSWKNPSCSPIFQRHSLRPSLAGIMAALARGTQVTPGLREAGHSDRCYRCIMDFPRPEHDTRGALVPRPVSRCVALQGSRRAACF